MKQIYSVVFTDKSSGRLLRRFDYPANKIISKFFWEKIKLEELNRLSISRVIDKEDILVSDITAAN